MGKAVLNFSLGTDYATPDNETFVELHMALPFTYEDLAKVQGWFAKEDLDSIESYLAAHYPQHRKLLSLWCDGVRLRKEAAVMPHHLVSA